MIRSSTPEVRSLIAALASPQGTRRDAAVARLTVIGARAVPHLIAAYAEAGPGTQRTILGILEVSGDERALPLARRALGAPGDLGAAAVALLRALLERGNGAAHTEALDLLLTTSTDPQAARRIRAAAAQALTSAPEDIRTAVGNRFDGLGSEGDAVWDDAAEGRLPEDPGTLMELVDGGRAGGAPLPVVRRILEAVRAREAACGDDVRAGQWRGVRGALHVALAERGSRLALYDAREALEAASGSLPASFLTAVRAVGDASCLDALACAYARAGAGDAEWRQQLEDAFRAVIRRERLTRRHPAVRRALARAPALSRAAVVSRAEPLEEPLLADAAL